MKTCPYFKSEEVFQMKVPPGRNHVKNWRGPVPDWLVKELAAEAAARLRQEAAEVKEKPAQARLEE